MTDLLLQAFVRESNRIEGIKRAPLRREVGAHLDMLSTVKLDVKAMVKFVAAVQPDAQLRSREGLNVRVGNHVPPPGSAHVVFELEDILRGVNVRETPYTVHRRYETLHPFTDGNGRSGRAVWLWQMLKQMDDPYVLERGFLHTWYYQSLTGERRG